MRALCTIAIILAISLSANSQLYKTDLQKAESLHMRNYDSAIFYSDRVLAVIENVPDSVVTKALFIKGWNYYLKNQYRSAIDVFHRLLLHTSEGDSRYIRAVGRMGVSFKELNQVDSALYYLHYYDELVDDHFGEFAIEGKLELGELYRYINRTNISKQYKLEAVDRARSGGNRMDRVMTLFYFLDDNISNIAEADFQPLLNEYLQLTEKVNLDGSMDRTHSGMLLLNLQGPKKMKLMEEDILELENLKKTERGYLFLNKHLVDLYIKNEEFGKARIQAHKGLDAAIRSKDQGYRLDYLLQLSSIEELQSNFFESLNHLKSYYRLKDSLLTLLTQQNVDSLMVQYETANKERVIVKQQLEIQNQQNQKKILLAGFLLIFSLAVVSIVYWRNRLNMSRKINRQEVLLHRQKIEQLERERKLLSMTSMIEGQEAERIRIARDLHDGLGGLLGTVKAHFGVVQSEIDQLESMNVYDKLNKLIDHASSEVRRISHNMAPYALQYKGLNDALKDLCEQNQNSNVKIKFEWIGDDIRIAQNQEIMLYRIVQELLNNIFKYSKAKNALVQVNRYGDELNLIVEDDGCGFDYNDAINAGGIGLKSVESRVNYLGGCLDVDSKLNMGTSYSIQIKVSKSS